MSWKTTPEPSDSIFTPTFLSVDELYNVRDTFFPINPLDKVRKIAQLQQSSKLLLDSIPQSERNSPIQRATYEYLRGKILDASSQYSKEAEDHLSKAVKLNPSLGDAWLSLGNCIWKKGELVNAMNCLNLALNKGPHKKILCLLSMLERKLAQDFGLVELTEKSIKHAKEAVSLDVKDGYSWYNLGNAYLTDFMTLRLDLSTLQQAMKAYQNAERDERMHSNPDLYFNSGTAHKYLENYERALSGFEAAALKDPGLRAAEEVERIVELVSDVDVLLRGYGGSNRLAAVAASVNTVQGNPSCYRNASIDTLQEGDNRAAAIVGKVLHHVQHESVTPEYYLLCDSNQTCYILTIYEAVTGAVLPNDQVVVLDPSYRHVDFSWKGKSYKFSSVRVDDIKQLLVNGMPLNLAQKQNVATPLRALHKP